MVWLDNENTLLSQRFIFQYFSILPRQQWKNMPGNIFLWHILLLYLSYNSFHSMYTYKMYIHIHYTNYQALSRGFKCSPCVTEHQIFPRTVSWRGEALHLMRLQSCPSLQPGSNTSNTAHSDWSTAGESEEDIYQTDVYQHLFPHFLHLFLFL